MYIGTVVSTTKGKGGAAGSDQIKRYLNMDHVSGFLEHPLIGEMMEYLKDMDQVVRNLPENERHVSVWLDSGKWFWGLKPDLFGEVPESPTDAMTAIEIVAHHLRVQLSNPKEADNGLTADYIVPVEKDSIIVYIQDGSWIYSTEPDMMKKVPGSPKTAEEAVRYAAEDLGRIIEPDSVQIFKTIEIWADLI